MIKQCLWIPRLETKRLILRKLEIEDADDLQTWLWRPEVYTYWGTPLGKGEHDARKLFIDPRPHVKRKPSHDFIWGVELRESNKVIGILEVFDVVNDRIGTVGYRISPDLWNQGICTEAMRRVVDFIFTETTRDCMRRRMWKTRAPMPFCARRDLCTRAAYGRGEWAAGIAAITYMDC